MNSHERGEADADPERDGGGHPLGRLLAPEEVEKEDWQDFFLKKKCANTQTM
jgi:hypothetical protein